MRADVDEADHREIGEQREQAREESDAERGWHEDACTALRREHVARSSHRVEKWLFVAFLELSTKPADMHVDHVSSRVEVIIPDLLEEHRAGHDAALVASKIFEQQIFAGLEVELLACALHDSRKRVDLQIPAGQPGA